MRFSIGYAAPLTGPQSIVGVPMLRVVEMAASDLSRDGLELGVVAVDDEAEDRLAPRVARELVNNSSVLAVVGHKNSGPSGAAAPVYAAAGLAQLSQCATDNALTRSGWRTFFRLCADNEHQAAAAAEYAAAHLAPRAAFAIHDRTSYGQPLVEAFAKRLEALTATKVLTLSLSVGQEDFSEIVERVRDARADLVYIGATEIEGSKLMTALRRGGSEAQLVTSEGGPQNPLAGLAGAAAEGSIHTYAGEDPTATEPTRRLIERCEREFGSAPSFAVETYEAVMVIADALAGGASTRDGVLEAIAHADVEGFAGRIRFDASGDRAGAPVSLWRVSGGLMLPVALQPS
ncbi:MAG TPA: branched-chain amino acid ABC transporter substrate-binding protein [Candidatus Dormibacteraeota bacterium]|nr:branched-chain amino acid ABC transporter substrate-binding protein [Candidatus Dormibacteraeota bacterium]